MQTPDAVIFDLDGTLIDAFADIAAAVNAPLIARGMPTHTIEQVNAMVGNGAVKLIERASPPGTPREVRDEIYRDLLVYYAAHPVDHAKIYDGILDVLKALRERGIKTGILSNKPHTITLKTCDMMGLTPYFDEIIGEREPDLPRKPNPQSLLAMIDRMKAKSPILVGDGVPDGDVAKKAGIPYVAALWGSRTREQLSHLGPVAWGNEPRELTHILLGESAFPLAPA
ncbi:HAD-IA family hydrolase [Candidatus Sumerlaeota bacterium]|nr:HAD-IA family hydrolase [Candidatus Sumerlaeota bacterium]